MSPKINCARQLAAPLIQRIPVNLRSPFEAAAALNDNQKPEEWALYVMALANMLLAPEKVLTKLDLEGVRYLHIATTCMTRDIHANMEDRAAE